MKSAYEVREIAYHLIDGGWTKDDKDLFIEENAKQDEENILSADEIDQLFEAIAEIEAEKAEQ